jgi:hypothetical protein
MQKPVHVPHQARQRGRGSGVQHRGDIALVEHHTVVGAPLDDTGDAEAGVCCGDVGLFEELKPQPPDLNDRGAIERRVAVLHVQLARHVARQAVGAGAAEIGLVHARPAHRQRQDHERIAQGRRHVERRRQRIAGRAVERRSVREHAARGPKGQLAELEQGLVDLDLEKSIPVRAQSTCALIELRLEMTIVLLEVLGLQERPLGPDNAVVPAHARLTSP